MHVSTYYYDLIYILLLSETWALNLCLNSRVHSWMTFSNPFPAVVFTSFALFHWNGTGAAFLSARSWWSPRVPPPLLFLPALFCLTSKSREWSYSCQTLIRTHTQPRGHTTCDTQTSQDERCCPPLWLDDGWARMGTQHLNSNMARSTALGFPLFDSFLPTVMHPLS